MPWGRYGRIRALFPAKERSSPNLSVCLDHTRGAPRQAPLEFRYDSKPDDIARSFNVTLGWRVGILYDSFTKVDYTHNGEDKTMKDKQWHGMNRWRQAVYLRTGYGGFGAAVYYNYTPLFEAGKGPEMTKMNTVTVTLFVNGF